MSTRSWSFISRPAQQGCMDACSRAVKLVHSRGPNLLGLWLLTLIAAASSGLHVEAQSVVFDEAPPELTSNTTAAFHFTLVAANGGDPCAANHCSIQCKRDVGIFQDCLGRAESYKNLSDGAHSFSVAVNVSGGAQFSKIYTWVVDTVPPTATIDVGSLYTNAVNISIRIQFSEVCNGGGGFQCSSASSCDLLVYGPGIVFPSTLKVLTPGLLYSIQVGLSTLTSTGRVTVVTARQICSDSAGNSFQRSSNSSAIIKFSRTLPTVNLWTAIENSKVVIGNETRTIQATNNPADLNVYLDFTEPIVNTSAELQSVLNITSGILVPVSRKSHGNRRFGFLLTLNDTRIAVVTITLPGNTTFNRYGTAVVESTSVSFLYDIKRPQVQLSTTARAHTQDPLLPVVVQFTKPVFFFNASGVRLSGGGLRRFTEISKTTYALVVSTMGSKTVSVSVAENQTRDIAGNPNTASISALQVKHFTTPSLSIALYSFITAGILGTAFASGALAVSSVTLAAVGAIPSRAGGCVGADPSRNLLGMAGHMQVLAFSGFLSVSLPIEYAETAKGLRWLIPHVNPPWQRNLAANLTSFGTNVDPDLTVNIQRRRLLTIDQVPAKLYGFQHPPSRFGSGFISHPMHRKRIDEKCSAHKRHARSDCSSCAYLKKLLLFESFNDGDGDVFHSLETRRRLGANGTQFGPPLSAGEYATYFLNQATNLEKLKDEIYASKYTGWTNFQRNLFWLAVVGGGLIIMHILAFLLLRWRTKKPLHGALSPPRFEIFVLFLALPALCQASTFIIRDGAAVGIVVGALLLFVSAVFLVLVALFLIFAILLGRDVQYKEVRRQLRRDGAPELPPTRNPVALVVGNGYQGKWVKREGVGSGFVPRLGILFEDRKGPPRIVTVTSDDASSSKSFGQHGLRRIITRSSNSDDESELETVPASWSYTLLGCCQSVYILMDLCRRVTLGVLFGAYRPSDKSWVQVSLVFAITIVQLVYLITTKPYRRRGVQLVETVSLLCEVGVFSAALALLARGQPQEDHFAIGIFMLVLFVSSFVAQSVNEWFALIRQLLALSKTEDIAPKQGLKELTAGLILPYVPRSWWSKLTNIPPERQIAVEALNTEPIRQRSASGSRHVSPLRAGSPVTETGVPTPDARPTHPRKPEGTSSSEEPTSSTPAWPGEDLIQWRRQNSMERKQNESNLIMNTMVQEITTADPIVTKTQIKLAGSPSSGLIISRSWQRRNGNSNRIHHSFDSLSLSDLPDSDCGDLTPDIDRSSSYSGGEISFSAARNFEIAAI